MKKLFTDSTVKSWRKGLFS